VSMPNALSRDTSGANLKVREPDGQRERVLFIGTQCSNLYTAVDTPARGRVGVCVVFVCKYVLGHSRVSQPLNLRLCLLRRFGFLTSPHASPTCRRRRLTSYRLLRRSTPGPPPNLRGHLLHLPASPRPPLYTPTITTQLTTA
jgi:hypothetical protein